MADNNNHYKLEAYGVVTVLILEDASNKDFSSHFQKFDRIV